MNDDIGERQSRIGLCECEYYDVLDVGDVLFKE